MILIHDKTNQTAATEIQKFCLINRVSPKIQVSQLTGKVMYYFEGKYPEGVADVEYSNA